MIEYFSVGATEILVRNELRQAGLSRLPRALVAATEIVYEQTRIWYDSRGDGSWPPLAESTVMRKASQGLSDPERPLYAEGNLYESATSASGPYSYRIVEDNQALIGVDWAEGGWQIPVVHHHGTDNAGVSRNVHIPARPIWPAHSSPEYQAIRAEVRAAIELAIRPF